MLKRILSAGLGNEARKEIRKCTSKMKYGWILSAFLLALVTEGLRFYRKEDKS